MFYHIRFFTSTCPLNRTFIEPSVFSWFSPSGLFTNSRKWIASLFLVAICDNLWYNKWKYNRYSSSLSKQLEWYSMKNLVFDLVKRTATQFMIFIAPWASFERSVQSKNKLISETTQCTRQLTGCNSFISKGRIAIIVSQSYHFLRQTVKSHQRQMWQTQGNGHLSWCHWCTLKCQRIKLVKVRTF